MNAYLYSSRTTVTRASQQYMRTAVLWGAEEGYRYVQGTTWYMNASLYIEQYQYRSYARDTHITAAVRTGSINSVGGIRHKRH